MNNNSQNIISQIENTNMTDEQALAISEILNAQPVQKATFSLNITDDMQAQRVNDSQQMIRSLAQNEIFQAQVAEFKNS